MTATSESPVLEGVGRHSLRPLAAPLSGIVIAQFAAWLSGTIVATSVPTLMADLNGPPSHATWLVAATILAGTSTTPIWGKLGDLISPKIVLVAALSIFLVGLSVAILSTSTTMLIVARAIQGLGLGGVGAGIAVAVASLVGTRERGRVNGLLSIVQTTAQLAAPVLGGVLATAPLFGWRWAFMAIFPLVVTGLLVITFTLKLPHHRVRTARIDYAGALLIGVTVTALLFAITTVGESGITDPVAVTVGSLGIVLFVVTLIVEKRAVDPIMPIKLIVRRTNALVLVAALCSGTTMFTGTVFASEYLQFGLDFSPAASGIMLIPMAVSTAIAAWLAGRYMSRTGHIKPVLVVGFVAMLGGAIALALIGLQPVALAITGTVLVASGLGLLMQNLVLAAQNTVEHEHVGAMSATVLFVNALGGTIAVVCSGALLDSLVRSAEDGGASTSAAYVASIPWIFAITAGVVAIGLVASMLLPRMRLRTSL